MNARPKLRIHLEKEVSRPASEGSFCIRCRRNKRDEMGTEIINIVEDIKGEVVIISRKPKTTKRTHKDKSYHHHKQSGKGSTIVI